MAWRVPWPWTLSVSRMPLQIVGRDSETYTTLDGNPHALRLESAGGHGWWVELGVLGAVKVCGDEGWMAVVDTNFLVRLNSEL